MYNSEKGLLESKTKLKVGQIYVSDFKDIIHDAGITTYQRGKTLFQSWITKIIHFPENLVESSIQECQHFFDLGPVPDDFDYSFLMM